MEHVKILKDINVADIQRYLASCPQEFEASQLYSSTRNEKFTDEDLRKSIFRPIKDTKLFELVDSLISKLNGDDASYKYSLRRNDVTHIKYEKGGFFRRHRDFLSTTSNLLEEFTLLVCVTPANETKEDIVGGDTSIHFFDGAKSFNTTTAGSGILFRKDLEHEGLELMKGEKHVITANIYATRKEHSKQVLLVTFSATEVSEETDHKPSIMDANESASYALPVDILSGMLLTHVQWENRRAEEEGRDEPPIVSYECREFDFDTFGVVEKVLNRSYVEEKAILAGRDCLDYFGPFKYENMLVDLSLKTMAPSLTGPDSKKARKGEYIATSGSGDESFDTDIIICETEARMRVVSNVAKVLDEPYVPFKILFVEGMFESDCEGDKHIVEVPMMAVACLVGDHDNILFLRNVCDRHAVSPTSFQEIHSNSNVFKQTPAPVISAVLTGIHPGDEVDLFHSRGCKKWDEIAPDSEQWEVSNAFRKYGYGLGLKVSIRSQDVKSAVVGSCLNEPHDMLMHGTKTVYLPGLDIDGQGKEEEKEESDTAVVDLDKSTFDRVSALAELRPLRVKDLKLKLSGHGVDWTRMIEKEEMLKALCDAMEVHAKRKKKVKRQQVMKDNGISLFHRNENGEVVFSEMETDRASDFVAATDIEERVKASLQKKRFVLPQQTSGIQAHFCNESVYGKLNVLWVSGVIRMEDGGSEKTKQDSTKTASFDAWPSERVKASTNSARDSLRAQHALNDQHFW